MAEAYGRVSSAFHDARASVDKKVELARKHAIAVTKLRRAELELEVAKDAKGAHERSRHCQATACLARKFWLGTCTILMVHFQSHADTPDQVGATTLARQPLPPQCTITPSV